MLHVLVRLGLLLVLALSVTAAKAQTDDGDALVARFQSVISAEVKWQLKEKTGRENPDYVFACVGGGSNAAGAFYHYLDELDVKLVAVEAAG